MAKDIYQLIEEKYPGVELESPVQGWVYLEDFEEGIKEYERIDVIPSSKDDRWLGVCYFQLFDDMKALEVLQRAISRKSEAAKINLAHLLPYVERASEAGDQLAEVDMKRLSPYDLVLWHRVKSIGEENDGDITSAFRLAEMAWQLVQGIPEFPILAPKVLNQLGTLHGRIGRAHRALWCFDRALEFDNSRDQTLLRKVTVFVALGRYEEAFEVLKSFDGVSTLFTAERQMLLGDIAWARGDSKAALGSYKETIQEALDRHLIHEEFRSRLSLVAILGQRGDLATANEHAARAQNIINDKSDRLAYRFREILLMYWRDSYTAEHAKQELEDLAETFRKMGLLQEQGWVRLHVAEMQRLLGDEEGVQQTLDDLQALSVALQNPAFLAREWTLVPNLREIALTTHPKIVGKPAKTLEVYTMGEEQLVLEGKVINIRMSKALEIIAYFLEHQRINLKKLMLDVFADEEPKKARNYFHQFRHELHERLPGLEIDYNPDERLYTLKSDMNILWDVAELRAGRKMGDLGLFLQSSGSDWALELEHELEALKEGERVAF